MANIDQTEFEENILKTLCVLEEKHRETSLEEIYSNFDLSRRKVNIYLKSLQEQGYLQIFPEEEKVRLTERGRIAGLECRHRHEALAQFMQFVGVGEETAAEDACRMEHVVSSETVQKICDFVNYGETFERVIRGTDLSNRYHTGEYSFLMGIYQLEKRCPRRLSKEFFRFSEEVILQVTEGRSSFLLKPLEELKEQFWYMDPEQGWRQAKLENGFLSIPTSVFEYFLQQKNPVMEGSVLVALVRNGKKQTDELTRELNVHIW